MKTNNKPLRTKFFEEINIKWFVLKIAIIFILMMSIALITSTLEDMFKMSPEYVVIETSSVIFIAAFCVLFMLKEINLFKTLQKNH